MKKKISNKLKIQSIKKIRVTKVKTVRLRIPKEFNKMLKKNRKLFVELSK